MSVKLYQVDAFTNVPFGGNPAAVCLLNEERSEEWMQKVAAEMNLSETAFLVPNQDGYSLRWFTPKAEVKLCGHATLASAFVLYETGLLSRDKEARFHTLSGLLTAYSRGNNEIELNFPAKPLEQCEVPPELIRAIGAAPLYAGRNDMDYLLELEDEDTVRNLKPNFAALKNLPVRGVIVTSAGAADYDFVSRFFAPAVGIDEDPVTGSAHCALAPYWNKKTGKSTFSAYQASDRGGSLKVAIEGNRVVLRGQAVMVFAADLFA